MPSIVVSRVVLYVEVCLLSECSTFTNIHVSDLVLTICGRHNVLRDTDAGAWVKRWFHCGGRYMSLSRCVSSEIDCPLVFCCEEVVHENDLLMLVRCFDGQPLRNIDPSLVDLHRPFSHLYFTDRFDYWACDCKF